MNYGKNKTIYFKIDDREIPLVSVQEEPMQIGYTGEEVYVRDYHDTWSSEIEISEESYQEIESILKKIIKEHERNKIR